MTDIEIAKEALKGGNTCVIVRGGETVYRSSERGIKPLLRAIDEGGDLRGSSAADLIVGRAAAFLYLLMGVEAVYAEVMSEGAKDLLKGIETEYGVLTDEIRGRSGGKCPMESAVEGVDLPEKALEAIREKAKRLNL